MRYAAASERKRAIRRITRLKPEEQESFLKLLDEFAREDLDPSVREASVRTMGKAKYKAGTKTIVASLGDERREVRLAAISALSELESDEAKAPLADLLKQADFTESDPTLGAAIRLLGKLKHKEIAPFLKEKAEAESTETAVRLAIVLYFGRAGAVEMNDYLMSLVHDDDAEVITRAYAVNSVGKLKEKSRVPGLREELDKIRSLANPRERARFSALKLQLLTALVRLGDDSVEKELLAAARDDDARVRVRAIGQIGEARMEKARPLLQYIIDYDASKGARQAAIKALKLIDGDGEDEDDDEVEPSANAAESSGTPGGG
ncbi:MAG: HEAT repeat domain-containing protein [bacterium]|nr:HEAT repeat domain-containing protein [bacterium]